MPVKFVESWQEFAERHGGDAIDIDQRWLFSDGAMADIEGFARYDPPEDDYERLRLRRKYFRERLRRTEEVFLRAQADFAEQALWYQEYNNMPGPPENAAEILLKFKAEADAWRDRVAEVDAQIAATPKGQWHRANDENRQSQLNRNRELRNSFMAVRL